MSATIFCRPIPEKGEHLPVWAPSSFIAQMEKAFGSWPLYLEKKDIPTLKGMAAVSGDGGNPWPSLIEAIEKYGCVELWSES